VRTRRPLSSRVDEIEEALARLDQRNRDIERAEDGRVFNPDHPGADHRQAAGQPRQIDDLVAVEDMDAVERDLGRAVGPGAHGDEDFVPFDLRDLAVIGRHLDRMRAEEARRAGHGADGVSGELMLEDIDLVIQRLVQPGHEVLGLDILLHAVGTAVEATLPVTGEVQHRLPHGLGRDGAGMDRDAANAPPLLDDEDGIAQLGGLDGSATAGWPAADDEEVVSGHAALIPSHSQKRA
jgi:hypothetical protein